MSVCRPARCLFSKPTPLPKLFSHHRPFHTTPCRNARRRPQYPNIKAADLNLIDKRASEKYPAYKPDEEALLAKKYSASQLAAIKAAEAAIDPRDLVTQGQERTDPWRLPYEDDLAQVDPILDHPEKIHTVPGNGKFRETTFYERETAIEQIVNEQMAKMYPDGMPENLDEVDQADLDSAIDAAIMQAYLDPRTSYTSNSEEATRALADPRYSVIMPELPRIDSRAVRATVTSEQQEEVDPRMNQLLLQLGWPKERVNAIRTKTLVAHNVTNQTRMGKIRSMYYLTIAGNMNGLLGVGEGKSTEPEEAMRKAKILAIRNMKPIPRYEGRTIYGEVEGRVGAVRVQLSSRPPGFGLRVQSIIFEMARAAGIQDLSARVPISRNKMNTVKAVWQALINQKLPEDVARARGKKLVDVRKVYYGRSAN